MVEIHSCKTALGKELNSDCAALEKAISSMSGEIKTKYCTNKPNKQINITVDFLDMRLKDQTIYHVGITGER